jgi:hypothetical protein
VYAADGSPLVERRFHGLGLGETGEAGDPEPGHGCPGRVANAPGFSGGACRHPCCTTRWLRPLACALSSATLPYFIVAAYAFAIETGTRNRQRDATL